MALTKTHINLVVALALLSSQNNAIATEFQHQLSSTTISNISPDETDSFCLFSPIEGEKHSFSTVEKVHYAINTNRSNVSEVTFINSINSTLNFSDHFDLTIEVFNSNDFFGLVLEQAQQDQIAFGNSFNLNTTAHDGNSTALLMVDSNVNLLNENAQWRVSSETISENDENIRATAIELFNSNLKIQGSARIEAIEKTSKDKRLGTAISLESGSEFTLKSAGNTQIIGNIQLIENIHQEKKNPVEIELSNATDFWIGDITNITNGKFSNGNSSISLSNGAVWAPQKDNGYQTLHWGKDGVIDLSHTDKNVRLGLSGFATDDQHITSNTKIENGAVLQVRISDKHVNTGIEVGKEVYLLNVENAQAIGSDNIQITVNIIDDRKNKNSDGALNIPLIHFDKLTGGITLKSNTHEYETGLGKFQTITEFGSGISGGFVINDIRTDLLGPSTLANNLLDFASSEMVVLERLGNELLGQLSDRTLFEPKKGLWGDVHHGRTETLFDSGARKHDIKSASLMMGYDSEISLPYMHDSYAGILAYFSQNDVDIKTGSAESNAYGLGLYAGGLSTEKNYRLMMQAYIGQTDSKLSSLSFIDGKEQVLGFNSKSKHYGVGFYMGFVQKQAEESSWFWEPFIAGQSYWLKPNETNEVKGISFAKPENHQSVVKLGTTIAYQCANKASNTIYTQMAWVHRFGKSVEVLGTENSQTISFQTPDLQESWGEVTAGVNWAFKDTWHLRFKTTMGYAQNVKPRYDLNTSLTYVF